MCHHCNQTMHSYMLVWYAVCLPPIHFIWCKCLIYRQTKYLCTIVFHYNLWEIPIDLIYLEIIVRWFALQEISKWWFNLFPDTWFYCSKLVRNSSWSNFFPVLYVALSIIFTMIPFNSCPKFRIYILPELFNNFNNMPLKGGLHLPTS